MISLQKTASTLNQIKNRGISKLEAMAQLEKQSLASPSSVKVHLALFQSAFAINKIDVMKGWSLALTNTDAFSRIRDVYTLNPSETRSDYLETQLHFVRSIVRCDSLSSRAARMCHDPGLSFIPEADDKYALMLREALPAKPTINHLNFVLLFHVNRGDTEV
jgi:hypothetical protein